MDYKLMMLAAVAVALIAITSAADDDKKVTKCVQCTGDANSDCAKGKTEGTACPGEATMTHCKKDEVYTLKDFKTLATVTRSCAAACVENKKGVESTKTKTFCCDSDNCNGVSSVSAGVTTVVLAVAAVFLKNLY